MKRDLLERSALMGESGEYWRNKLHDLAKTSKSRSQPSHTSQQAQTAIKEKETKEEVM